MNRHGFSVDPALLEIVKPGAKLRRLIGTQTPNPTSEIWHIRAIVDDTQIVYRYWRKGKGWRYVLTSWYELQYALKNCELVMVK